VKLDGAFKFQWLVLAIGVALFFPSMVSAQTPPRKSLPGHIPPAVSRLQAEGFLPATNQLRLAIGLPLRNEAVLDDLLRQICDPASPNFRHFLTPEQFTEQFGPTAADYQKVIAFAQANGLTVTDTHGNRLLLDVSGSVADIQNAFQLKLRVYQHPTENRKFFSPDAEPSVDVSLPVADISGLNNYSLPHPKIVRRNVSMVAANATPKFGSGPSGTLIGADFRTAYASGTALNGAGQMVGLVQFDGFYSNDIVAYENLAGLSGVPLQTVLLDGYNGVPTTGANSGNVEVSLDIEMAVSMAPGLSKVVVFEAGPNGNPNDVLNAMAASNQVKQLSSSWGWSGGPSTTTDNIFKTMAAQGQSFFNASGDSDAFTTGSGSANGVDNPSLGNAPSSSPYITQVGGTTLATGSGGDYGSETVWNWGGGIGSSGGISSYYSIPSWQANISMAGNGGSASFRNIPDVALTADNCYVAYANGSRETVGGTSCAAPLWAGFMALVNQQAAAGGQPPAGFINPAIYAIAQGGNYTSCFHDITAGDNTWSGSPNNFSAVSGYDLCTGLGTPNGQNLINALAGSVDPLVITPSTGFAASGTFGGPFSASGGNFFLTNSGAASLDWSLTGVPSWLDYSSSGGTLAPGGSATVAFSLDASAANLAVGNYSASVIFSNIASGVVQNRQFTLQVADPLAVFPTNGFASSGIPGGTFNAISKNYSLTNLGSAPLAWAVTGLPSWLNVSPASGTLPAFGSVAVAVSLNSTGVNLPAGVYAANVTFLDLADGVARNVPATLSSGQSLVQNGGFETGDFTGWALAGKSAAGYNFVDGGSKISPFDGDFSAVLGEYHSTATLSQTLATIPKQRYLLTFWLEDTYVPKGGAKQFAASWNGKNVLNHSYASAFGWIKLTFTVTATKTSTVLQFKERNDPWYFGLDDVSVTPVPVPTLQAAVNPNGTFKFTWNALPDVAYQIQYKTNLMQADWINLGETFNARANSLSATNAAVTDPQRFYRVVIPDQTPAE
jgi:subtilase family serine protease